MELISNGYFDSGELSPWVACAGTTLAGGGITDLNLIFLSDHNLRLIGNDCVRQSLPRASIVSEGSLNLWVKWGPRGVWEHLSAAEVGWFEVRVEYSDGGDGAISLLNRDALFARGPRCLDAYALTVAVDRRRYVTGVSLRCIDAAEPWYVCGVTMEGYFVGGGEKARASFEDRIENTLERLERRLARMELRMAMASSHKPKPPKKVTVQKG